MTSRISSLRGDMEQQEMISYFAHEGMMTRMERTNHRLWVTVIILIVALIATNLAWIVYESQFEYYEEQVVEQSSDNGINNFIGKNGSITNGAADS